MEKLPMTAAGHAALEAEFARRQQVERPRIIAAISEARSHGDLSENAEYHAAKDRQGWIEGRIAEIEDRIDAAWMRPGPRSADELLSLGETVLERWVEARGEAPTRERREGFLDDP